MLTYTDMQVRAALATDMREEPDQSADANSSPIFWRETAAAEAEVTVLCRTSAQVHAALEVPWLKEVIYIYIYTYIYIYIYKLQEVHAALEVPWLKEVIYIYVYVYKL
jgi:hypothetical protein